MNKKQMISNGMLATMAMTILSVIFVVLVCREAIVTQAVVSVVCFVLAAMAMSHVKVPPAGKEALQSRLLPCNLRKSK